MAGERGARGELSSTLHLLEDVVPSPGPPTLTGLEDASATSPTASTPMAGAAQAASPGDRYGTPPRQHYLLSASSESSLGSDGSGTPLQPAPLPAITLPIVPAAATTDSSESSYGMFDTPKSHVSETGSAGEVEAGRAQHLLSQRSSSPLRTGRSAPQAPAEMVAAGVMGTSISLQPRHQQTPLPLTQQRSPLAAASSASAAQLEGSAGAAGPHSSASTTSAAFSSSIAVPALGVAAAGAATAAAVAKGRSSGAGNAAGEAGSTGGGTPPKPPPVRASKSSGAGSSSSKATRKGAKGSQQTAGEITPEAASSRQQQPQQQSSAVAALTADIIAAAAAGAAAGAALAAIAELGEDQQQRQFHQQQQHLQKESGERVVSPGEPSTQTTPRDKQLGTAQETPAATSSPGFSVLDPAAAAAAAKSARRRSKPSRSRTSSTAGVKVGDIAAAADIEQPAAQQTPRQSRSRSSAGGAKKTLLGSLTALLGIAAWKRGAAAKEPPVATPPSSYAETASSQSAEPAPAAKDAPAVKAAPPQTQTRKKWVQWGLLALCLLALLFGIALAIGITVSKQNADKRARAMQTTAAAKGPKGPPLTFKVDVEVPPDDDPTAPPICGSMFGASPGSNKKVESFLTVFKKSYASALKLKPNEVGISSVSCNNKPVQGAGQPAAPSPPDAALPRPAHKRLLLGHTEQGPQRQLAAAAQASTPAAPPATLSTEFQVPAPADPAEREKLTAQVKESSQAVLTGPLSEFFGRPVSVRQPVQLSEPTRKPQAATTTPVPRVSRPVPGPETEPESEPSDNMEDEVPADVELQPDTPGPPTKTTKPVVPSPKPRPVQSPRPKTEVTPTLPLQLPKPAKSPKPAPPPRVDGTRPFPAPNGTLPSPGLNGTLPSPSPKPQKPVAWSTAPGCKFKADGQNSVPDTEGRLWGWQNGESCTFKTLFRTPIYITWSNAPTCKEQPATSNSVYDRSGRLWGWQDDRSCSFRGTRIQQPGDPNKPVLTWSTAASCKGSPSAMNSVKTRAGELWGWENGESCAFRIHDNGASGSTAPKCKGLANYYNSVRDSLGRPWGWEDNHSCRF